MNEIKAGEYVLLLYLTYYLFIMFLFRKYILWKRDMITAIMMAVMIGFVLNILRDTEFISGIFRISYWETSWWPTIKICIVPFCVSSFSALGPRIGGYIFIFPSVWFERRDLKMALDALQETKEKGKKDISDI